MSAYSKSCFITLGYKGHYIHSHYDSDLKAEVVRWQDAATLKCYPATTWRAAQLAITKHVKEKSIESTSSL